MESSGKGGATEFLWTDSLNFVVIPPLSTLPRLAGFTVVNGAKHPTLVELSLGRLDLRSAGPWGLFPVRTECYATGWRSDGGFALKRRGARARGMNDRRIPFHLPKRFPGFPSAL